MGVTKKVTDQDLILKLIQVFKNTGFGGTTMAQLAEQTGLKKASLYHRFPGGKEQMALETLEYSAKWYQENIIQFLEGDESPEDKIKHMVSQLEEFYNEGQDSCLINMLAPPISEESPFRGHIQGLTQLLMDALEKTALQKGLAPEAARFRAEATVAQIQGSLVICRGMGSTEPFRQAMLLLPEILFGR